MSRQFYIRGELVPYEEDFTHEFKGHKNICVEDLPPWTQETKTERASRRAVSRALNAFLNTGKGGTLYLGVIDSGLTRGLQMSDHQKQHVLCSLDDVFSRYNPPVKSHRYSVDFVPVADSEADGEKFFKSRQKSPQLFSDRPHILRSHSYCWCDKDAVMQYNAGVMPPDFVIEIHIKPWDPCDPLNKKDGCGALTNIHPIHEDEEGNCYFRRQASLIKYTMSEIAQLTRQEVQESCLQSIDRLKREIALLESEAVDNT